ncbi:MAG: YdcF family protein [Thermodesulfobacteriota bacterium]|jgi:uncharacterized SAM-binding protein YcdF (DUF218 family)
MSLLLLYLLSTPLIGGALLRSLEDTPPLPPDASLPAGDAIVVLGGAIYHDAPEYGGDTVSGELLERLQYAARLYRLTGKPILVTGGNPGEASIAEAVAMRETLVQDFQVPVRWVEDQSRTTLENARLSAPLLQRQGVQRVYLVTHAAHMPRARAAFEHAGLQVIPAPTRFTTTRDRWSVFTFLPNPFTLAMSHRALHEWFGRLWYWLQDRAVPPLPR